MKPGKNWQKKGKEEGNIEYFANLQIKDGKITPAREIREGWEKLSPIGVLPRSPDNIGTIHTHPGESFFSPVDFFSFLARPDVVMAMVYKAGAITLMIKTRNISFEEKTGVFLEMVSKKTADLTRSNIETEEETYRKLREEIRFILDSAEALGIVVMRKEKEEEKFKVVAGRK